MQLVRFFMLYILEASTACYHDIPKHCSVRTTVGKVFIARYFRVSPLSLRRYTDPSSLATSTTCFSASGLTCLLCSGFSGTSSQNCGRRVSRREDVSNSLMGNQSSLRAIAIEAESIFFRSNNAGPKYLRTRGRQCESIFRLTFWANNLSMSYRSRFNRTELIKTPAAGNGQRWSGSLTSTW